MGNRLILVLHWVLFAGGMIFLTMAGYSLIANVGTDESTKTFRVDNDRYDPSCVAEVREYKATKKFCDSFSMTDPTYIFQDRCHTTKFLLGGDELLRRCEGGMRQSSTYAVSPTAPSIKYESLILGIVLPLIGSILIFITQGRWIWFPWQHDD